MKQTSIQHDLFRGTTDLSICFMTIYNSLMNGEWWSVKDLFAVAYESKREKDPTFPSFPRHSYSSPQLGSRQIVQFHNSFKKAMMLIQEQLNGSVEDNGKRKGKELRYVGTDEDPLRDVRENQQSSQTLRGV